MDFLIGCWTLLAAVVFQGFCSQAWLEQHSAPLSVMQQWKWPPQTLAQHLRKTTILTRIKQSLKWLQIKQNLFHLHNRNWGSGDKKNLSTTWQLLLFPASSFSRCEPCFFNSNEGLKHKKEPHFQRTGNRQEYREKWEFSFPTQQHCWLEAPMSLDLESFYFTHASLYITEAQALLICMI